MSESRAQVGPNVQLLERSDCLCQTEACDAKKGKCKEKGARNTLVIMTTTNMHAGGRRVTAVRKIVGRVTTGA